MPSQRFPIRGGFYALADRHWSQQDVLNYLPLPSESGGTKTEYALIQAPGLRPYVDIGDGAIRGSRNVEGRRFVVSGNQLYQISPTGVAIPRGTIPGTGRVSMAHNQYGGGHQLVIDNGTARYVYDTSALTLEKVTDSSFPGSFCAFYIDQYLGFVEPQGRYWGHSDLADALDYNSLDTYEAEADPDRIVAAFVSHREVLIFGRDTIEPYVNAPEGDGTAPFVRASNTVIECGCAAKFSVAGMDNSVFWLDDKRIVRRLDGYTPVRISNAGIEQALAECSPEAIARAYAFTYEDRGFKVYYLTVPGVVTFGYDLRTQEWHRRSSPDRESWRLSTLEFWDGVWVGGDATTGKLYTLDWDYSFDGTEELVREYDSGVLFADQRRIEVNTIEPLVSVGAALDTVDSFDAQPGGPTITGDGLDGVLGLGYVATYTLSGGTPPYTVTLRSGGIEGVEIQPVSGTTCDYSGTPTLSGTKEWVVRVTDANGLWDDLTDTCEIAGGLWLYGPTKVGGVGAETAYLRTTDPTDWATATEMPIPTGMAAISRISAANGKLFMHAGNAAYNARVSTNGGATWTECDHPLKPGSGNVGGVFWNGSYYYWMGMRSADGVTWAAIPNLPAVTVERGFARTSDGLALVAATNGNIYTTLDNGGTWTTRTNPYTGATFRPFATNGTRIGGAAAGGIGYGHSDDAFATAAVASATGPGIGLVYGNGVWIGQRVNLQRSTDGSAYSTVLTIVAPDVSEHHPGDYGDGVWVWAEKTAPSATVMHHSTDDAATWATGDTINGSGGYLVFLDGIEA